MIRRPAAPLPPTPKTMKMKTVLCISYDSEDNRTSPGHFPNHENDNIPMHFLWFLRPAAPLPPTSQTMKMYTVLWISYDCGANRTPPGNFQNYENDNSPMHVLWFWGQLPPPSSPLPKPWKWRQSHAFLVILEPNAPHPGTSKTMKRITVLCISCDSEASRPLPPTSKAMEMKTVLCISYDCGANHTPPGHFQTHENDDRPMHFLWLWGQPPPSRPLPKPWKWRQSYAFHMILEPTSPLLGTSKTMKMITVLCIALWFWGQPPPPTLFQNHENEGSPMLFFGFWSQSHASRALPKPCK